MMIDRPEDREPEEPAEPADAAAPAETAAGESEAVDDTEAPAGAAGGAGTGGGVSTQEHADKLRDLLTVRREAEQLRGQASRMWEEAASEAEKMVSQAQQLANQLVEEAKSEAKMRTEAAASHAAALTAGAEAEAVRLRKEAEDEATTSRLRAEATLKVQMDEVKRQMRESLEGAGITTQQLRAQMTVAATALEALEARFADLADLADADVMPSGEEVRTKSLGPARGPSSATLSQEALKAVESAGRASTSIAIPTRQSRAEGAKASSAARGASRSVKQREGEHDAAEPATTGAGAPPGDSAEGRPLGWLFRAP